MRPYRVRASSAVMTLLFGVACGGEGPSAHAPILPWDTASVPRLVISEQAAAEAPRWSLGPRPALEIGQVLGDTNRAFGRIADVLTLQGGRIVVADEQANELRFFDTTGRLEGTAGRTGDGPGEFRYPHWILECARDSVFAYDVHDRFSVFSAEGAFARTFRIETVRPPYNLTCSQEGLFVTQAWPSLVDTPIGPYETVAPTSLSDASGRLISSLGEYPGDERTGVPGGSGPRVFGQTTHIGVSGDAVYVGVSDRYEIGALSTSGVPRAVFGIDLPARRVNKRASMSRVRWRRPRPKRSRSTGIRTRRSSWTWCPASSS